MNRRMKVKKVLTLLMHLSEIIINPDLDKNRISDVYDVLGDPLEDL